MVRIIWSTDGKFLERFSHALDSLTQSLTSPRQAISTRTTFSDRSTLFRSVRFRLRHRAEEVPQFRRLPTLASHRNCCQMEQLPIQARFSCSPAAKRDSILATCQAHRVLAADPRFPTRKVGITFAGQATSTPISR